MMARCPKCGGLYGPTINALLTHMKEVHGLVTEWYEVNTGNLKLLGYLPGTLEFVPVQEETRYSFSEKGE